MKKIFLNLLLLSFMSNVSAQVSFEFQNLVNFVEIPAGVFQMGSPEDEQDRESNETLHDVAITYNFEMQVTEVTQLQWYSVMGIHPDRTYCVGFVQVIDGAEMCPTSAVSGFDIDREKIQQFLGKLNTTLKDGYFYRLPTEAEWEYAARAGNQNAYIWGNSFDIWNGIDTFIRDSKVARLDNYGIPQQVGRRSWNRFKLFDMIGNACEYVQEFYKPYTATPQFNPGDTTLQGQGDVIRGGGLRFAQRDRDNVSNSPHGCGGRQQIGFRLVRTKIK